MAGWGGPTLNTKETVSSLITFTFSFVKFSFCAFLIGLFSAWKGIYRFESARQVWINIKVREAFDCSGEINTWDMFSKAFLLVCSCWWPWKLGCLLGCPLKHKMSQKPLLMEYMLCQYEINYKTIFRFLSSYLTVCAALLCFHCNCHFQGYPTCLYLLHMVWWPDGHIWPFWPYMAIHGHLAIGLCATNIGEWGIPEKSYQNLAQQG